MLLRQLSYAIKNQLLASSLGGILLAPRSSQHQDLGSRVEHSHWSRSLQILCSDWWNLTMLAPRSTFAITTHLKERKMNHSMDILCLLLCCYDMYMRKESITGAHNKRLEMLGLEPCLYGISELVSAT